MQFCAIVAHALIGQVLLCAVVAAREPAKPKDSQSKPNPKSSTIAADKAALTSWQPYIGRWKGVGQPKRGSNQGAWTESADWAWQFDKSRAAIAAQSPQGKFYSSLRITPADMSEHFELVATRTSDKGNDRYDGALNSRGEFVFLIDQAGEPADRQAKPSKPRAEPTEKPESNAALRDAQQPKRITLRQVADGKRLLVLYERRIEKTDQFVRLAEVGYTREGSDFAKAGSGGPECVVTGGLGTIAVQYRGQTYYVCCSGCQGLFNEDPAGVLADYRARKEKEKKK